jgi:presenilin-like A22 family membrane protease
MTSPPELRRNPRFTDELVRFLLHRKKWYLIPTAGVILIFGLLLVFGSTAAAPFIYTLF